MLTNEQCIEIAEKVWGWIWVDDPNMENGVWFDDKRLNIKEPFLCYKKEIIGKYVNSWQGFGRTMQKLATRNNGLTRGDVQRIHSATDSYLCVFSTKEEYWEKVHLAALECINNEKD